MRSKGGDELNFCERKASLFFCSVNCFLYRKIGNAGDKENRKITIVHYRKTEFVPET